MGTSVETHRPSWVRTRWGIAVTTTVAAVMLAVGLATWVGPQPMHLGFQTTGDAILAQSVRGALGLDGTDASTAGYRGIGVAELDDGQVRWAGLGNRGDGFAPTDTTPFEIGSITKLFTGLMLADAVDRGEVRLGGSLDAYLPLLSGTPAGSVTLEELATHRSGLPAYADDVTGATYEGQGDSDVASISADDVVAQSATLTLSGRGTYQYSNLGVSLLGYALTKASGAPSWVSLVTERVLRPAHMGHTTFAASASQVPPTAAVGRQVTGMRVPYSVGPGYFPAGTATFSTLEDLTAFARWIIDGRAIGLWALEPRYDLSPVDKIGLVWMTTSSPAGTTQWHNGSVPGFNAILRLDLQEGRAVAVMGNTDASVEVVGTTLLDPGADLLALEPWAARGIILLAGIAIVGLVLIAARSGRPVVHGTVTVLALVGLVLAVRYAPWQVLPGGTWAAGACLVTWASLLGAERGRPSTGRLAVGMGIGVVVAVIQYAMTVWLARLPVTVRAGVALVAALALVAGCVQAPSTNPQVTWSDVTPAGVVPASLAVSSSGVVVGGTDETGEAPMVVGADGTAVRLVATEPYAATAAIVAASISGDELYLLGGRSGGAHGNVRWTVWDGPPAGAVTSREQDFFTFGGHDAGPLLGVVPAGERPIIVGSRGGDAGPMAALYSANGSVWKQLDTPAELQSVKGTLLGFTAVASNRDLVVLVGDVVRATVDGVEQTPAMFYGTVGGSWRRVDLPVPGPRRPGLRHATGVACDGGVCWVVGWAGRPMAWRVGLDAASVQILPALDGAAPTGADPVAVVTLVNGRPVVLTNAASPYGAVLCGARWTRFPTPTSVTAAVGLGHDAYLIAGSTPRLWRATMPSC